MSGPARRSAEERFVARLVKTDDGCWTLGRARTYAWIQITPGRKGLAHRFSFERARGPIPDGLVIDHLCRNAWCVNPDHLEAVTTQTNTLRGLAPSALNAKKERCVHGHPLSGANLYRRPPEKRPGRECATCRREAVRRHRARKEAA